MCVCKKDFVLGRYVLAKGGFLQKKDMLVLLLCCMMKIVEFSTGKPVAQPRQRGRYVRRRVRRGMLYIPTLLVLHIRRDKFYLNRTKLTLSCLMTNKSVLN